MEKLKILSANFGLLWLRVLMGLGIAYHGYAKIFVRGVDKFALGVAKMGVPFPEVMAWAAALSEFAGGILIAVGLGTRIAALFVFGTMTVAAFVAHGPDPLFKTRDAKGFKEFALLYWTIAGALVMMGGGRFSLDHLLSGKKKKGGTKE